MPIIPEILVEIPKGWFNLTEEEAEQYQTLPRPLRLQRYIKDHFSQHCPYCNRFVGNHSIKAFTKCLNQEIWRLKDLENQKQLGELLGKVEKKIVLA